MTRSVILALKLIFGVVPSVGGALFALIGISQMLESQITPSKIFGRAKLTLLDAAVFLLLACTVIAGVACGVAWLKELRSNREKNWWLISGLIAAVAASGTIGVLAGYFKAYVWLVIAIPVVVVALTLLRREYFLER
jgi:ABC-type amino acid transport system permease subunit